MERDIYKKLAQHLDNPAGGFPPTETEVELRILRRHFWIAIVAWAVACVFPPVLRNL
jgi:hypothetical protein